MTAGTIISTGTVSATTITAYLVSATVITQNGFAVSTITNIQGGLGISVTQNGTGTVLITNIGVDSIVGGTDIAVTTSTGQTVINSTGTLQTVTSRGASTTAAVNILNTSSSTNVNNGALTVAGGVGISGSLYVGGTLVASQLISNGYAVSTATALAVEYNGTSIGAVNALNFATGTNASINAGVVTVTVDSALNNLQSVTAAGSSTTNAVNILNTSTSALHVAGGVSVGRCLSVSGNIVGGGVRTTTTSTAPSNPTVGDIWYDTTTDTINRFTYDSSSTFWLDITGAAVSNASTVGMTATTIGANLVPTSDATYSLGDTTHRWAALYVGTGTVYIQDNITGQNAGLSVSNGILQVSGANQLQVGQLKFIDNAIESTSSNIAIQIGYTGDSANLLLNRNVQLAANKTLTFSDNTVQRTAFTSTNAVTRVIAGTGTSIDTSTGVVTISSTAIQPIRTVANTATVTIDFSSDQIVFLSSQRQNLTIGFTNYTAGSVVRVIVNMTGGPNNKITFGTNSGNSTLGGATMTPNIKNQTVYLEYFCLDAALANVFVSVVYQ